MISRSRKSEGRSIFCGVLDDSDGHDHVIPSCLDWDYSGACCVPGTADGYLGRTILFTKKGPAVKSRLLVELALVLGISGLGGGLRLGLPGTTVVVRDKAAARAVGRRSRDFLRGVCS